MVDRAWSRLVALRDSALNRDAVLRRHGLALPLRARRGEATDHLQRPLLVEERVDGVARPARSPCRLFRRRRGSRRYPFPPPDGNGQGVAGLPPVCFASMTLVTPWPALVLLSHLQSADRGCGLPAIAVPTAARDAATRFADHGDSFSGISRTPGVWRPTEAISCTTARTK